MSAADEWVSAEQAGRYLGGSRRLTYELVARGELSALRWPVRVRRSELERYVERSRLRPGELRHLRQDR